jgi:hypothetical protein
MPLDLDIVLVRKSIDRCLRGTIAAMPVDDHDPFEAVLR